ncbi:MAG TPA: DUF2784 domain-containing protein [Nocardioidaceae bacterium]|nr:DUF2784 domain-containing protein [Nocardioidaceae bacterium]
MAALAGVVFLVHLGYLVYATVGGFLALRSLVWLWPHILSTVWSVAVTLTPLNCPLTALEKWLIRMDGRVPYDDSFTAFYLRDSLYPARYEVAIWVGMIAVALLSYVVVIAAWRQRHAEPRQRGGTAAPVGQAIGSVSPPALPGPPAGPTGPAQSARP